MIYFKSGYFIVIFYIKHDFYIILKMKFGILIILYTTKFETQFVLNFRGCTLKKSYY